MNPDIELFLYAECSTNINGTCLQMCLSVQYRLSNKHIKNQTPLGFTFVLLSGMASLYTLMALSVQRCFYVFNPAFASVNGPDCAWILLGIIWSLAGAIALPPLFGWSEYVPENSGFG